MHRNIIESKATWEEVRGVIARADTTGTGRIDFPDFLDAVARGISPNHTSQASPQHRTRRAQDPPAPHSANRVASSAAPLSFTTSSKRANGSGGHRRRLVRGSHTSPDNALVLRLPGRTDAMHNRAPLLCAAVLPASISPCPRPPLPPPLPARLPLCPRTSDVGRAPSISYF